MSEWTDIGEQLRKARESKGLELKDVAHTTRIPLATLSALEESDYSISPSPTYARSFLSQYSEYLEVDAREWIDAFETGDVLSNDHGYLQSHNEHVGSHRHNPEPARRRGRNARRNDESSSEKGSGGGSSILQTLTVFFLTALFIGGGIYAYKKYEPMLTESMSEEKEATDDTSTSSDTPAVEPTTPETPKIAPKDEPPLVATNNPPSPDGGTDVGTPPANPATPTTPEIPVEPVKPNRTGKPPKAEVIEEDE